MFSKGELAYPDAPSAKRGKKPVTFRKEKGGGVAQGEEKEASAWEGGVVY